MEGAPDSVDRLLNNSDRRNKSERGQKSKEWGQLAEDLTVDYLISQGKEITERNYRIGNRLEIDIISRQGDELVFVEVKARNGKWGCVEDAVDAKKQKQLIRAANAYLKGQEYPFYVRFDIALIEGTPEQYTLTYIENAFYPV